MKADSKASAGSFSASPTSARSPGRSRAGSPERAPRWPSPSRASASRRACASWPSRSRARSSRPATCARRKTAPRRGRGRLGARRSRLRRALGRLRRRRGSGRSLHRHAARSLLDGARYQRLLAGGNRPRRRAPPGRDRRLDRDHDLSGRRASGASLQRDGRRQGDSRRLDALSGLGSRRRRYPRQRGLRRPGSHARRALDRRLPDHGGRSSPSGRRCVAISTPRTSPPPAPTCSPTTPATSAARSCTWTPATTPWACSSHRRLAENARGAGFESV